MKTTVCILTLLGCTWAIPSAIDWSKVKNVESFMQPLPGVKPEKVNARVVGGKEAKPHSLPYQVAVLTNGTNLCGGSLISPEWVLTAAHCTMSASFVQIILGAHNIVNIEPTQVVISSTNINNHPDFDRSTLWNDVSLIRLPLRVNSTSAIQLIKLASPSAGNFTNETALASGWGLTSDDSSSSKTLRSVNLTVISNDDCKRSYGSIVQPSTICTSGTGHVGVCSGDSGGPLVIDNVLVGVVSFGGGSCEIGLPSGYARVSSQRPWINSLTGI